MYEYILGQYRMGKVNKEWVCARCPRWLTNEQVDMILKHEQDLKDKNYNLDSNNPKEETM